VCGEEREGRERAIYRARRKGVIVNKRVKW
jgi:hypothetical protein